MAPVAMATVYSVHLPAVYSREVEASRESEAHGGRVPAAQGRSTRTMFMSLGQMLG